MGVIFKNGEKMPDGAVLLFAIRYVDAETGVPTGSKIFTYTALKVGGRWYFTGSGRVPQDAGWGAVQRWLSDPIREVVSVRAVTETVQIYPHTHTVKPHQFTPSYSGMVCDEMVQDANGNGDQCGRPSGDPVHQHEQAEADGRDRHDPPW